MATLSIHKVGVEIEGEFHRHALTALDAFGAFGGDGSLRNCPNRACEELNLGEFRSKPYINLKQFEKVFDVLKPVAEQRVYHFNDSCGFHIHVSFKYDDVPTGEPHEVMALQFYEYFVERLKAELPDVWKKRHNNRFCLTPDKLKRGKVDKFDQGIYEEWEEDRYRAVNVQSLGRHSTIEFRIFPADEPTKMASYLAFTLKTINNFLADEKLLTMSLQEDILPNDIKRRIRRLYKADGQEVAGQKLIEGFGEIVKSGGEHRFRQYLKKKEPMSAEFSDGKHTPEQLSKLRDINQRIGELESREATGAYNRRTRERDRLRRRQLIAINLNYDTYHRGAVVNDGENWFVVRNGDVAREIDGNILRNSLRLVSNTLAERYDFQIGEEWHSGPGGGYYLLVSIGNHRETSIGVRGNILQTYHTGEAQSFAAIMGSEAYILPHGEGGEILPETEELTSDPF